MAISDVLYETEEAILECQSHGVIAVEGEPEIELIVGLMRAVRMMPGRDRHPDAPNTFAADLARELAAYDDACRRRAQSR